MLDDPNLILLERAVQARSELIDEKHEAAVRLFNGFLEGGTGWTQDLLVDLYARTLVLYNYADDPDEVAPVIPLAQTMLLEQMPWLQAVVVKTRASRYDQERRGRITYGTTLNRKVREHGVWYAVNLTINLDASLYLDTRALRAWAIAHLSGKRVLNTFAYTGSLGLAATAGGARQVIQTDLSQRFLNVAKDSCAMNGFPVQRADFIQADFWTQMSLFNRNDELFDCIFVDPPFFSVTGRGRVDMETESQRVINKVRPLVAHQGWLVTVNNALFLSGADYMEQLQGLCADGYLAIEEIIPIPPDCTGYPETITHDPPVETTPFNHSTKIAILRATRKDERTS